MFTMPYHLVYEYLNLVITVMGILLTPANIYLGIPTYYMQVGALVIVASLLGIITSIGSVIVNEKVSPIKKTKKDYFILLWYSFLEVIFFRPLTYVIRLQATLGYKRYVYVWDSITRKSFGSNKNEGEG